jgi:hypothetical protein
MRRNPVHDELDVRWKTLEGTLRYWEQRLADQTVRCMLNRQVDHAAVKLSEQRIAEINEELVGLDAVIKERDERYRDHPEWGSW